jgi:membrane protease YdiL (CAAX protease family)
VIIRYLVIAFSFTWAFWWLAVLEARDVIPLPIPAVFLGAFGPMVAALTLAASEDGRAGLRSLLSRVVRWRVRPAWYGVALLGPPGIQLSAMALYVALGGQPPGPLALLGTLPTVLFLAVYYLLFVALPEEIGWRGYALPALQARYSALLSGAILGLVWATWHLPLFFNPSTLYSNLPFPLFVAWLVPLSILLTWVFNGTGGSVLMAALLHAGVNASSEMWKVMPEYLGPMSEADAAAATVNVNLMGAVVLWVAALIVVLVTGPRDLSRRPRQVP